MQVQGRRQELRRHSHGEQEVVVGPDQKVRDRAEAGRHHQSTQPALRTAPPGNHSGEDVGKRYPTGERSSVSRLGKIIGTERHQEQQRPRCDASGSDGNGLPPAQGDPAHTVSHAAVRRITRCAFCTSLAGRRSGAGMY